MQQKSSNSLREEKETIEAMQKVASKHGENAVNAFVLRDEISAYIIDENLDITATQLDELLKVHFNGEDIKQTKSELDAAKILKIKKGRNGARASKKRYTTSLPNRILKEFLSFLEVQTAIRQLQEKANRLLIYKQNTTTRFRTIIFNLYTNP
ncbi:MAG: hypothetical protein V8T33_15770 [Parabacteroides distasonis]